MEILGMVITLLLLWGFTRINKKPMQKLIWMIDLVCDSFEDYINQLIKSYANYYKRRSSHNRYDDVTHQIDFARQKKLYLAQKERTADNSTDIIKQSPLGVSSLITMDLVNTDYEANKLSNDSNIRVRQDNGYGYPNQKKNRKSAIQKIVHSSCIISKLKSTKQPNANSTKKILPLILATLLILSVAGIAIASDITNAEYRTTIAATNNSTATTNVAIPFTLSTSEMIDVGMLSANASDAAMISSGGSDTAFMPASDNSSPWITWLSSIGTDSQVLQYLYSKGVTGGKLRYFPGDAGMSANDSATLELGDNFTVEQSGWIDTTQVGANLTDKYKALRTYISASGNITSGIWDWSNTTGFTDAGGVWSNEANAYDDDMSTNATVVFGGVGWSSFLELAQDVPHAELLQYYIGVDTQSDITQVDLDAYYSGGWNNVYEGAYSEEVWTEHSLGASYNVTSIRMRVYNQVAGGRSLQLTELAAGQFYPNITASGVSSGEHIVATQKESPFFGIDVDADVLLPVSDNLVANIPLWQTESDNTTFTSIDNYAHTCNVSGANWTSNGYIFDGTDDLIEVAHNIVLEPTTSISVEVWVYFTQYPPPSAFDKSYIVSKGRNSTHEGYTLKLGKWGEDDYRILWELGDNSNGHYVGGTSGNKIQLNTWYHLVATWDDTEQGKLYTNTEEKYYILSSSSNLSAINYISPSQELALGTDNTPTELAYMGGYIGEVRIYDKALTLSETTQNYNATRWKYQNDNTRSIISTLGSVPDNSSNWTYYEGTGGYWEYTKIWIGDTLQQNIEWEYNAVEFTDLSGNGHNADPTFRTTSSNANVSAEVTQQEGLVLGSTPSSNVSGGWTMITSVPATPEDLFAEGGDNYSIGGFNIGELVTDTATGAGHPPEVFHFLVAFGLALIAILATFGATHNSRMGRQGSLAIALFMGGVVLVLFYRFTTVPGWILIPYGLGSILLVMWKRSPSPVD